MVHSLRGTLSKAWHVLVHADLSQALFGDFLLNTSAVLTWCMSQLITSLRYIRSQKGPMSWNLETCQCYCNRFKSLSWACNLPEISQITVTGLYLTSTYTLSGQKRTHISNDSGKPFLLHVWIHDLQFSASKVQCIVCDSKVMSGSKKI